MPVYTFTFPAAAGGLPVSIADINGLEVTTSTLAETQDPPQGAVVLTRTLDAGAYVATASDAATYATFRSPGVLDLASSLGDGSSALLDGAAYWFERMESLVIPGGSPLNITWDTILGAEDGYTDYAGDTTMLELPDGIYAAYFEVYTDSPATDRLLSVRITAAGPSINFVAAGPAFVPSTTSGAITGGGTLVVFGDAVDKTVRLAVEALEADSSVSPSGDITVSYAIFTLRKIA